jgi:hypothetical protein
VVAGHAASPRGRIDAQATAGRRCGRARVDSGAATPALQAALHRLVAEGRDNSHDARDAIAKTLTSLGVDPGRTRASTEPRAASELNADDLRRLASPPRARVTIRGVGVFDFMLITAEAPATVLRFVRLAESGYYNGLTFHRVVPNFVIQGAARAPANTSATRRSCAMSLASGRTCAAPWASRPEDATPATRRSSSTWWTTRG